MDRYQEVIILILIRRIDETLVIDDDIKVTVLNIAGNQVKIGIEASKEIPVDREEIHQRKVADPSPLIPMCGRYSLASDTFGVV